MIANGDVTSLEGAREVQEKTGVDGVMVARALLENPALFDGYKVRFNFYNNNSINFFFSNACKTVIHMYVFKYLQQTKLRIGTIKFK